MTTKPQVLQQSKVPVYKVKAKSISVSGTASQLELLWEWTKNPAMSIQDRYQVSSQPDPSEGHLTDPVCRSPH